MCLIKVSSGHYLGTKITLWANDTGEEILKVMFLSSKWRIPEGPICYAHIVSAIEYCVT